MAYLSVARPPRSVWEAMLDKLTANLPRTTLLGGSSNTVTTSLSLVGNARYRLCGDTGQVVLTAMFCVIALCWPPPWPCAREGAFVGQLTTIERPESRSVRVFRNMVVVQLSSLKFTSRTEGYTNTLQEGHKFISLSRERDLHCLNLCHSPAFSVTRSFARLQTRTQLSVDKQRAEDLHHLCRRGGHRRLGGRQQAVGKGAGYGATERRVVARWSPVSAQQFDRTTYIGEPGNSSRCRVWPT